MAPRNPSLSSMTAAEFAAALKAHGFRVVKAKIEDATAQSPASAGPQSSGAGQ
jgi:hypothetical protein